MGIWDVIEHDYIAIWLYVNWQIPTLFWRLKKPRTALMKASDMAKQRKPGMSDAQITEAARHFTILSEPARLRILRSLMAGPQTVTQLVAATGLKQGNVSKHLGVLFGARFVSRTKEGNFARYAIADPDLFTLCELMCNRIDREVKNLAARLDAR